MTARWAAKTDKPRSKYRAQPVTIDGHRFASKAEARRYGELKILEKRGEITELELQPVFQLAAKWHMGGMHAVIGKYVADFRYRLKAPAPGAASIKVVEDVKGFMTPLAKWKIKHVEAQYGIKVEIVK